MYPITTFIILALLLLQFSGCKRTICESDFITIYEKSNFLETPRYKETVEYCKKMADASDWLKFVDFGSSPRGQKLPLLICDKNGNFDVNNVRSNGNSVVMIQACIHAGECEGKDAGMMLIRDIVVLKKFPELLDHVTILFIPIFNVDGHERFSTHNRINQNGPKEMGWRTTSQNLNLNRDYLKADAPEMKQWLTLYSKWLPEFMFDCHTTDGADYQYILTYGIETSGNTEEKLTAWMKNIYEKNIQKKMSEKNLLMFPYVMFREWHDPRSGLVSWVAPPMLSGGYSAVQNRASMLIETHMLKDYKTRVNATYEILKESLSILNKEHETLNKLCRNADEFSASDLFRKQQYPVSFEPDKDSTIVTFKGLEYKSVNSELSGGPWFQFSKNPVDMQIPYFNHQKIKASVSLPEAYIISPEWTNVINRLSIHGIKFHKLQQPFQIEVSSYKFKNIKFSPVSYEGRQRLQNFDLDEIKEIRNYPAGSVIIDMNQRAARVIAHIFEPKARDAFVCWGFFNSVFEQKEYAESYVMEVLAREMLAKDQKLKEEFEKKKAEDKNFASNQNEILNWFYTKSIYKDSCMNVYPVGKIMDRKKLNKLLNRN